MFVLLLYSLGALSLLGWGIFYIWRFWDNHIRTRGGYPRMSASLPHGCGCTLAGAIGLFVVFPSALWLGPVSFLVFLIAMLGFQREARGDNFVDRPAYSVLKIRYSMGRFFIMMMLLAALVGWIVYVFRNPQAWSMRIR